MSIIAPGTEVPDFTLKTEDGEPFTRDDLAGKTLTYDVLTLFHRHHGQIIIAAG